MQRREEGKTEIKKEQCKQGEREEGHQPEGKPPRASDVIDEEKLELGAGGRVDTQSGRQGSPWDSQ